MKNIDCLPVQYDIWVHIIQHRKNVREHHFDVIKAAERAKKRIDLKEAVIPFN